MGDDSAAIPCSAPFSDLHTAPGTGAGSRRITDRDARRIVWSSCAMSHVAAGHLIAALGADIGLPNLQLDEEGRCTLDFDATRVTFELDERAENLFLYSGLGTLSADALPATAERLLAANLFWRGTGGATLAL